RSRPRPRGRRSRWLPGRGTDSGSPGGAGRAGTSSQPTTYTVSPMATQASARQRLDPEISRLPIERIRRGYYSDAYFVYTKQLLEAENHHPHVTMQVFQKSDSLLGGIDEALAVLRLCSGHDRDGAWIPG